MKTKSLLILLCLSLSLSSQVSTPFNFGGPADFVGWNAAQGFPLQIAHRGNQSVSADL